VAISPITENNDGGALRVSVLESEKTLKSSMKQFYVYLLSSKSKALYIGMTNNLERRLPEHKDKANKGYTAKYNINCLMYYESFPTARDAIMREKQLKAGPRRKKVELIEKENKAWRDLSEDWR